MNRNTSRLDSCIKSTEGNVFRKKKPTKKTKNNAVTDKTHDSNSNPQNNDAVFEVPGQYLVPDGQRYAKALEDNSQANSNLNTPQNNQQNVRIGGTVTTPIIVICTPEGQREAEIIVRALENKPDINNVNNLLERLENIQENEDMSKACNNPIEIKVMDVLSPYPDSPTKKELMDIWKNREPYHPFFHPNMPLPSFSLSEDEASQGSAPKSNFNPTGSKLRLNYTRRE